MNVTLTLQVPAEAMAELQSVVAEKSPVVVTPPKETLAFSVLVNKIPCAVLVEPTACAPKLKVSVLTPTPYRAPVPLNAVDNAPASLVTVSVPELAPTDSGANRTVTAQLVLAASVEEQVVDRRLKPVPATEDMPGTATEMAAGEVFVKVNVWSAGWSVVTTP